MPDNLTAALITAGGTVIGAAIPVLYRLLTRRKVPFKPLVSQRQKTIAGQWEGRGGDIFVENREPPIQIQAKFSIIVSGRTISADAVVTDRTGTISNRL